MKILYINKIHTNACWGFEHFLDSAFQDIGINTICIDYQQNSYTLAKRLLKIQDHFDALLLQRGCGYIIPLPILQAIRRPRFLLFTELVARNPKQHYLLKSGLFEHIFFRSIPCMLWVKQQKWLRDDQMSLLMSAIEPKFHRHITGIRQDIDILFIGTLSPRRESLIKKLSYDLPITVCSAFGENMIYLINKSKIILNLHSTNLLDTETRIYEVLACKGFLITETLSIESPFQNGVHLVEASNLTDLHDKIVYYLNHPKERQEIANHGYNEVLKNHTILNRAKQIKTKINEINDSTTINDSLSPIKKQNHNQNYTLDYSLDYSLLNYAKFLEIAQRASRQTKTGFQTVFSLRKTIFKPKNNI